MLIKNCANCLVLALSYPVIWGAQLCYAEESDWNIKTGVGDATIKHHLFNSKDESMHDALGDKFTRHVGPFGSSDTSINVFGNHIEKKHHLIGGTEVQATSIFGDKIESKKTLLGLGRRENTIDLKGVSSVIESVFGGGNPMENLSDKKFLPQKSLPAQVNEPKTGFTDGNN